MPDDVSLKDYIDTQVVSLKASIRGMETLMQQHFTLNDKALKLANEAMLVRLDAMNEFRAQIREERANMATKEDLITIYDKLDERIKPLETAKSVSSGQLKLLATLPAGVATILALIALFVG